MLQSIRIKNFQSLHDVDLQFGNLTVIIGESSSGKSAIVRALKAVSSNKLNAEFITQGEKKSAISLTTDNGVVTIERQVNDSSTYKVNTSNSKEPSFPKLNRQVPTQVTEVLGITPWDKEVGSINFASQFDPPYLLKDSSSSVARILGELTNVSTIFAAVKEANKKVKNSSGVLNLRKKDLAKVIDQFTQYSDILKESSFISKAETELSQAHTTKTSIVVLTELIDRAEQASEALSRHRNIPSVPDMQQVLLAEKLLDRFVSLIRQVSLETKNIASAQASSEQARSDILSAEEDLHQHLKDAGKCPLCKREM